MSNIIINDLTEIEILGKKSMARIQGGISYPVEPDGGIGGPGPSPLPEFYLPIDLVKLHEELFAGIGIVPSTPEPFPGADPLGGPF